MCCLSASSIASSPTSVLSIATRTATPGRQGGMEGASEGERQEKGGRKMTVPKAEMGGATTGRSATPPAPAASTLAVHRRHRR
jgi:hypothetical protein